MTLTSIPRDQVLRHIRNENPWWDGSSTIARRFDRMRPRPYLDLFLPLARQEQVRRAVVLMGPRRVGKTVLIHHAIQRLLQEGVSPRTVGYLAVDSPILNGLRLDELHQLYVEASGVDPDRTQCFLFLDEIQYLREWERHLKVAVDGHPAVRFVVSGSAAAALKRGSTESGAGRFTDFLLPPLTFHEYLVLRDEPAILTESADGQVFVPHAALPRLNERFLHYVNFGGYPEVALSPEVQGDPGRFVKSDIIDKVLLRDLPGLYGIQNVQELNSLFTTLAFNTANEVSLDDLSKRSGVSKNTIGRYLTYLEAAFLIKKIERIDRSAKRFRRAHAFKVYLTNPAMRCALFSPVGASDPAMGPLVETAIMSQMFHAEWETPPYYARWNKGEVDMVWLDNRQRPERAVEVKWTDRHADRPAELAPLISFAKHHGLKQAVVTTITRSAEVERDGVKLWFVPASVYCLISGYAVLETKRLWGELPWLMAEGAPIATSSDGDGPAAG